MSKMGILIVISGPSGAGKGTVLKRLVELDPDNYCLSISATTRSPRFGEVDGVNYFFKSKEAFEEMIAHDEFLEYAEFCGNAYGTPKKYINEMLCSGKNVILEIDVQGGLQVKEKYDDCVMIFLMPPSLKILEERLIERATEPIEKIKMRMERASLELEFIHQYDYLVINDILSDTVTHFKNIICAEHLRTSRTLFDIL